MIRRLLNLFVLLSLLLCAAATVEWVRTGREGDQLTVFDERHVAAEYVKTFVTVGTGRGLLSVRAQYERYGTAVPIAPTSRQRSWRRQPLLAVSTHFERRTFWQRLGSASKENTNA